MAPACEYTRGATAELERARTGGTCRFLRWFDGSSFGCSGRVQAIRTGPAVSHCQECLVAILPDVVWRLLVLAVLVSSPGIERTQGLADRVVRAVRTRCKLSRKTAQLDLASRFRYVPFASVIADLASLAGHDIGRTVPAVGAAAAKFLHRHRRRSQNQLRPVSTRRHMPIMSVERLVSAALRSAAEQRRLQSVVRRTRGLNTLGAGPL